MMTFTPDWSALSFGLGFGAAVGGAFFAGLRYGLKVALASRRPGYVLLASAAVRFALLLGALLLAADYGGWALAGFVAGLFVVRTGVLAWARADIGRAD